MFNSSAVAATLVKAADRIDDSIVIKGLRSERDKFIQNIQSVPDRVERHLLVRNIAKILGKDEASAETSMRVDGGESFLVSIKDQIVEDGTDLFTSLKQFLLNAAHFVKYLVERNALGSGSRDFNRLAEDFFSDAWSASADFLPDGSFQWEETAQGLGVPMKNIGIVSDFLTSPSLSTLAAFTSWSWDG